MERLIVYILLFFNLGYGVAQEVTFYAQAPRQVNLGQRFYLTFTVNQEGTGFLSPEIQHFEVLSGPSMQTSSQYQSVNGRISQSVSYSYTFVISATEAGTFTIPPATITVKGKKVQSNTVTINVIGQGNVPQARGQQRNTQSQSDNSAGNDIFLKAVANKSNPYLGEQIIVTYKLYTPTNRIRINPTTQSPSYPGFWAQDLMKDLQQYPQYTEVLDGKKYIVAEIRKEALFPQKSGLLTLAPFEQSVVYSVKVKGRNPFADDPFFRSFFDDSNLGFDYQNVEKTLRSNPVTINVKPLPQANRPVDYSGAVGTFTFKPSIDRTELKANEALNLKFVITGTGNLNLIEKPAINFPPDFEVYDPKITDNIRSSTSGVSGSRTFEHLVIPRTAGEFTIKPISFSFFDLSRNDYTILYSPEYKIRVLKGDGNSANLTVAKEDVQYIGNDIRHLIDAPLELHSIGKNFYKSSLFWLLFGIPLLLFLLFIVLWRNHLKLNSDIGMVRKRKATRVATARLRKAKTLLTNLEKEAFYNEISQALWGYISDKFNIPLSELSIETASERLEAQKVDSLLTQRFIDALQHCEFSRFAPGETDKNMEMMYQEALEAITSTEEQLK